jgi:hypothetical protein
MQLNKILFTLLFFLCLLNACKKDRLNGDNAVMVGTWNSTTTTEGCGIIVGIPANPHLKLEMMESGRYKLYRDNDKIESGRTQIINGFVTFKSIRNGSELDGKVVRFFNADTLGIDLNNCGDDFAFRFIR